MKTNKLLALDASSTKIGYSIWDKEKKILIALGHHTLENRESIISIADEFELFIAEIMTKYEIDEMVIEEAFQAFFGGKSSAHTTTLLNQVNALYQYICHKKKLVVSTITVQQARKHALVGFKLTTTKKAGKAQKDQVFDHLAGNEVPKDLLPIKTLQSGKRKGQVVYEDVAYDMIDAYVVGKGYLNKK